MKIAIVFVLATILTVPAMAQEQKCQSLSCFIQSAKIQYQQVYRRTKLREDLYHCIDLLKEASVMFPKRPEVYYMLGTFYAEINAIDTMVAYFDSVKIFCDDETIEEKYRKGCDDYYEKMDDLRQATWETEYNDGVSYLEQYDTIRAMIERTSPDNEDSLKTLDSLRKTAYTLSKNAFDIAMMVRPEEPLTYDGLAILLEREENHQEAVNLYMKAMELLGEDSALVAKTAYAYIYIPEWEKAIDWFEKYLEYAPTDPNALINLSVAYNSIGNYDKWYEYTRKVIDLRPENTQLLFNAGQYWFMKMQDAASQTPVDSAQVSTYRDSAAHFFQEIVEIDRNDADAIKRLGLLYLLGQEPQKAAAVFEQYMGVDSTDVDVLDYLGRAYIMLGDTKAAIRPYKLLLDQKPADFDAWERLAELYEYNGMMDEAQQAQSTADSLKNL
jgi:tetratricopeptide (TPR) repeat protein